MASSSIGNGNMPEAEIVRHCDKDRSQPSQILEMTVTVLLYSLSTKQTIWREDMRVKDDFVINNNNTKMCQNAQNNTCISIYSFKPKTSLRVLLDHA
jgi:hypothetical protein